jgi:hypothetical protein
MYEHILTSEEFRSKLKENDEVCVLAQAYAFNSMGPHFELSNKKSYVRERYIDKAYDMIKMLNQHSLIIIHKDKTGSLNEKE